MGAGPQLRQDPAIPSLSNSQDSRRTDSLNKCERGPGRPDTVVSGAQTVPGPVQMGVPCREESPEPDRNA